MPDEVAPFSPQAARVFADRYASAAGERQLAQSYWRDFFAVVCGIPDALAAGIEFEAPVRSHSTGQTNFIDVLWPGVVLIEHKSRGRDLTVAEQQGRDYLVSLPAAKRPAVLIASDFARIRLVNVLTNETHEFPLAELPDNLNRIEAVVGKHAQEATRPQVEADRQAADLMGDLFLALDKAGYGGHEVSVLLIRLLFLNFGDDTRMWRVRGRGLFAELVRASPESGAGLGGQLQELFQVLNRPEDQRPRSTPPEMLDFPYVNGGLFAEQLPVFSFTAEMRSALLDATEYNWAKISPAIFGAMFQAVKSKTDRRVLGEHYTSEANIMKVIRPLFLDDLLARMSRGWNSPAALKALREELGRYHYLDPAAGAGNFLVVAYQRLREIELKLIVRLQELGAVEQQVGLAGFGNYGLRVHLGQFHAIELDEWSSRIAQVAMYLADHQANRELEEITGASSNRFPLVVSADIRNDNALSLDWDDICPMDEWTVIMGNPPFVGARLQTVEQKAETLHAWRGKRGASELDYVANWFIIAARLIRDTGGRAGFVATNSISQGEQPSIIWEELHALSVGVDFAHRTFRWDNGTPGQAAVYCVIIGFSTRPKPTRAPWRPLYEYPSVKGEPQRTEARTINGYLVEAPDTYIRPRTAPLDPHTQPLVYGSMPNDGGHLSDISAEEAAEIRDADPVAASYLRRLIGAREFIHNRERYCLWLQGADPADIRNSPVLATRVRAVRELRAASKRPSTQKLAQRPAEFGEIRQPSSNYIVVPRHASEYRDYVPMGLFGPETITNDAVMLVPDGSLTTFGWLQSHPFAVWNRAVSGRLEGRLRISASITYNNFPHPQATERQQAAIAQAAGAVLDARRAYPNSSLADLYESDAMPTELRAAHTQLDRATTAALGLRANTPDERMLARLFELYDEATRGLLEAAESAYRRKRAART